MDDIFKGLIRIASQTAVRLIVFGIIVLMLQYLFVDQLGAPLAWFINIYGLLILTGAVVAAGRVYGIFESKGSSGIGLLTFCFVIVSLLVNSFCVAMSILLANYDGYTSSSDLPFIMRIWSYLLSNFWGVLVSEPGYRLGSELVGATVGLIFLVNFIIAPLFNLLLRLLISMKQLGDTLAGEAGREFLQWAFGVAIGVDT